MFNNNKVHITICLINVKRIIYRFYTLLLTLYTKYYDLLYYKINYSEYRNFFILYHIYYLLTSRVV